MYELLVRQEKRIADYDALYNALDGIGARIIHISGGGGWWSQQEKIDLIAATSGVLAPHFVERGEGDPMLYSYANELETLLKQSFTENTQYDFKQGIHNMDDGRRNNTLIRKFLRPLRQWPMQGKMLPDMFFLVLQTPLRMQKKSGKSMGRSPSGLETFM